MSNERYQNPLRPYVRRHFLLILVNIYATGRYSRTHRYQADAEEAEDGDEEHFRGALVRAERDAAGGIGPSRRILSTADVSVPTALRMRRGVPWPRARMLRGCERIVAKVHVCLFAKRSTRTPLSTLPPYPWLSQRDRRDNSPAKMAWDIALASLAWLNHPREAASSITPLAKSRYAFGKNPDGATLS